MLIEEETGKEMGKTGDLFAFRENPRESAKTGEHQGKAQEKISAPIRAPLPRGQL